MLINCPECQHRISDQAEACPKCGYRHERMVNCEECGKEIASSAKICPHCGYPRETGGNSIPIPPSPYPAPMGESKQVVYIATKKSRSLAAFLALVLGGLGIHKFYLNKPGWGLLYLMFCWTFIPAIIGFLEALFYIFMTDGEFQAKYSS